LLCVIFGAHLLLFSLVSLNDRPRGVRRSEEAPGILLFIELPKPNDTQPSTHSLSRRPTSTYDLSLESRAAPDNTITLPPEIEGANALIDWDAEASRVARDAARRMSEDAARLTSEEKQLRALDRPPAGMGPPPPKRSHHELGDSIRLEGGVIIDWTSSGCYYSNQDEHIPAFGPALRLQLPTCTGAGGRGGKPLQSFEEWKKERDNR